MSSHHTPEQNSTSIPDVVRAYINRWETHVVEAWVADVFGYDALQLGHGGDLVALRANRCAERYLVNQGERAPFASAPDADGIRQVDTPDFAVLPFASDSVDLVVLPHTLDEHPDPHGVLREAYRVLRAEGRMLILGFNPLSLWGAQMRLHRYLHKNPSPAFGCFHNLPHPPLHIGRLKDWLELLNCDVVQGHYGCYAPYVKQEKWLRRWAWMEQAGDRWWGFAGAVYALMVVKRVYSPTLVGLINEKKPLKKWAVKPQLASKIPQTPHEST